MVVTVTEPGIVFWSITAAVIIGLIGIVVLDEIGHILNWR
jgi:hypothetical protein